MVRAKGELNELGVRGRISEITILPVEDSHWGSSLQALQNEKQKGNGVNLIWRKDKLNKTD